MRIRVGRNFKTFLGRKIKHILGEIYILKINTGKKFNYIYKTELLDKNLKLSYL